MTPLTEGEIGNLLPNNQRQCRTCYALCHILYPRVGRSYEHFPDGFELTEGEGGVEEEPFRAVQLVERLSLSHTHTHTHHGP